MKVLNYFLQMQSNKEFYLLIKEAFCNTLLTDEQRISIREKADDLFTDLYNLFFECNSEEYNELVGFIKNN